MAVQKSFIIDSLERKRQCSGSGFVCFAVCVYDREHSELFVCVVRDVSACQIIQRNEVRKVPKRIQRLFVLSEQ
jgi:hypothetical protein